MDPFGFPGWSSDPFDFGRLRREMDDLLRRFGGAVPAARAATVYPPVNLYETEEAYVLMADLPGVRPEDLQVTVEDNRVTLRGERKIEYPSDPETAIHRRERQAGFFRRVIELPVEVDSDKAEATFKHGVLMVRLPKAPQHRPRQIPVARS